MPGPSFSSREIFNEAIKTVKDSTEEQKRIERAIGRSVLEGLVGKRVDLVKTYSEIGGKDPATVQIFRDMNPEINKINFLNASNAVKVAANNPAVAASKSSSIKDANPVFKVEGTALNTIADLGGKAFIEKYHIE